MFPKGNSIIDYLISDYTKEETNRFAHESLVKDLSMWVDRSTAASMAAMEIPDWNKFRGNQGVKFNMTHRKKIKAGDDSDWMQKFCDFVEYISEKTSWKVTLPQQISEIHRGRVLEVGGSSQIIQGGFDRFMLSEKIFSHAIVGGSCLRFTKHMSINEQINSLEKIFP